MANRSQSPQVRTHDVWRTSLTFLDIFKSIGSLLTPSLKTDLAERVREAQRLKLSRELSDSLRAQGLLRELRSSLYAQRLLRELRSSLRTRLTLPGELWSSLRAQRLLRKLRSSLCTEGLTYQASYGVRSAHNDYLDESPETDLVPRKMGLSDTHEMDLIPGQLGVMISVTLEIVCIMSAPLGVMGDFDTCLPVDYLSRLMLLGID
ncbi:hypothetical protein ACLB2K_019820 [Fragaria x ananassa]